MSMMAAGAVLMSSIKRLRHRGLVAYGSTMLGGLAVLMLGLPSIIKNKPSCNDDYS